MANITFSEASGVTKSIFGDSQAPIRRFIQQRGEEFERESLVKVLYSQEKSTHFGEKFTGLTAMRGFRVTGENGAYPTDGQEEGYSKVFETVEWKNSFSISRKIIEDSSLIDLKKKPGAFITAYYRTREQFGAALLGNAIQGNAAMTDFDGTFDLKTSDGKNLFAADHPAKIRGADQCNLWSDAFSADALGMLEVKMQNTRGDNGEILDVSPDTIVIPNDHSLKKAVFAAVGADRDPVTANNGYNYQFGRWNVVIWNYLNQYLGSVSPSAPWMLLDSRYNREYGTLVWLDRVALEVDSDVDKNTDANVWRGRARFTAGFHDWRGIACAGITGATALS